MFSFEVFRNPNSAKLLVGQLLSQVCDKMMSLGLVWVICASFSVHWVPWFLAIGALPHLLLSWKAGEWASSFGPLKTVVWTNAIRGVIFLGAGVLWSHVHSDHQIALLFAMTFAANIASSLFNPAILSLPGLLTGTDGIQQLTAAIDSSFSLSNIVGPALAAILYPWLGMPGLLILNGIGYFIAATAASGVRTIPATKKSMDADADTEQTARSSLDLLRSDSLIFFLLGAFFLMNLVLTPLIAFLPIFAKDQFQGQIGTLASLEMAIGIGTVAGSLGLSILNLKLKTWTSAILGLAVTSLMYLLFSLNHQTSLACLSLLVLGLALSLTNISLLTLFQTRPASKDVPVVMSLVNLISVGALPFSMILIGALIEHIDLHLLSIGLALTLAAITAVTAFHREFRTNEHPSRTGL